MRLLRYPGDAKRDAVAVVGNFDGVHLGHAAVIAAGRKEADRLGAPLAVATFEPHPRRFFRRDTEPFQLTTLTSKERVLGDLGVDFLVAITFDAAMASLPPDRFVTDVLVHGLGVRHLVVGYDFVFGKGRAGTVETLRSLAAERGVGVTEVAPQSHDGVVYASTAIRNNLREGRPADAARLLGRCWEIEGPVLHGAERGRTIGVPTANLVLGDYLHPALGVYAVWVGVDGADGTRWLPGCTNIGMRPTFDDGHDITVETHIFEFDEDIYGCELRVALADYIRPERKFAGFEELKDQIARDLATAREILGGLTPDDVRNAPARAAAPATVA